MKQILSPNFYVGRKGYKPKLVVIHIMDGSLLGTDEWFSNINSRVSSHYGVGLDGEIHQYVLEENTAFTEGNVRNPTAKLLIKNVNPNYYCLSIENEGHDLSLAPEMQLNVLAALIKELCDKHNIPIDRDHIIGHFEIDSVVKVNCPSPDHRIMDIIVEKVECLSAHNKNKNMIKWIKCYTSGSDIVNTYDVAANAVESVGETHAFTSPEDAQPKSTTEVLIIWDNELIGQGSVME